MVGLDANPIVDRAAQLLLAPKVMLCGLGNAL
jgi:hypothetical protein